MSQPQPLGPFKLVTVNTTPERARMIVGRVVEAVKDKYTIIHAANAEGEEFRFRKFIASWAIDSGVFLIAIKDVAATVEEIKPDLLVCLSRQRN
jgi:hypothetical protein